MNTTEQSNESLTDSGKSERKQLADRLRQTREFLGLSQQEAADAAGLTRLALSSIETGRRRVESVELSSLARVYRQPVTFFLSSSVDAATDNLAYLARAVRELGDSDRTQLLRFAEFLKQYRVTQDESPKS